MATRAVLSIIRRARAGDPVSQLQIGSLYLDGGEGLPANKDLALIWLDKAADQGCVEAWRLIGKRFDLPFTSNAQKLIRWFEMAANDGCPRAATTLAKMLLSESNPADYAARAEKAIGLLRIAANARDAVAEFELGVQFLKNLSNDTAPDTDAIEWLERAYADGEMRAARHLADYFWLSGDTHRSRLWYSRCVDLRDVELCYRFGVLSILHGDAGELYLMRAAKAGHRLACEELGLRYALGWREESGTRLKSRNFKQAVRWLERAALIGSAKACFLIALIYNHQNCSFRNRSKTHEWMLEAAKRGHPEAQYRTAIRMLRDTDLECVSSSRQTEDDEPDATAIRFLIDAKRQGHVQAARALYAAVCRATLPSGPDAAQWASAIAAMSPISLAVAMRMELASVMGLRLYEMMFVDPVDAHRGDFFYINLRSAGVRPRRRIVLIEHPAQREVADRVKSFFIAAGSLFTTTGSLPEDLQGDYDSRYLKLGRLCASAGIDRRPGNRDDAKISWLHIERESTTKVANHEAFISTSNA